MKSTLVCVSALALALTAAFELTEEEVRKYRKPAFLAPAWETPRVKPTHFESEEAHDEWLAEIVEDTLARMNKHRNTHSDDGRRIVGGEYAKFGEIPYQMFVVDTGSGQACGGILVESNKALTAAHCLEFAVDRPTDVYFFVGDIDKEYRYYGSPLYSWQWRVAELITVHPDYDALFVRNDLGVAWLRDIKSGDLGFALGPSVHTVDYSHSGSDTGTGDIVRVSGWGSVLRRNIDSLSLDAFAFRPRVEKTTVEILEPNDCSLWWADHGYGGMSTGFFDGVLCVMPVTCPTDGSHYITGECTGFCQGDSGGPVITDYDTDSPVAVGIISFTSGCGIPVPDGVVDIAYFSDWIDETLGQWPTGRTNAVNSNFTPATTLTTLIISLALLALSW